MMFYWELKHSYFPSVTREDMKDIFIPNISDVSARVSCRLFLQKYSGFYLVVVLCSLVCKYLYGILLYLH